MQMENIWNIAYIIIIYITRKNHPRYIYRVLESVKQNTTIAEMYQNTSKTKEYSLS